MIAGWLPAILLAVATAAMSPPRQDLEPLSYEQIDGWSLDQHDEALRALRRSCAEMSGASWMFARQVRFGGRESHWRPVCEAALSASDARRFFETNFRPFRVDDGSNPAGLFTGYYEPETAGSLTRSDRFPVPLYGKPRDLIALDAAQAAATGLDFGRIEAGRPRPYFTRKEIESGALSGQGLEIAWVGDWADAFFMQVQGAGRIRLESGEVLRLGFAAKSGRAYTSIGALLVERGVIPRDAISMQSIRAWMAEDEEAARHLMWENESFVFFRRLDLPDPALGPYGAGRVQLTPRRSMAVDRGIWMFGTPMWLATTAPRESTATGVPFRRLMIAQDTGSAIRGMSRGDIFWGSGPSAAYAAGHMQSTGSLVVLLPNQLAADLDLPQ